MLFSKATGTVYYLRKTAPHCSDRIGDLGNAFTKPYIGRVGAKTVFGKTLPSVLRQLVGTCK